MTSSKRPKRRVLTGIGVVAAAMLAVVAARLLADGRASLSAGTNAQTAGHVREAIYRYREAASTYFPGNTYSRNGFDHLLTMAESARATGDRETARRAYEAFRSAALGTRSFYVPHAEQLATVEAQLAEIYTEWDLELTHARPAPDPSQRAKLHAFYAAKLTEHPGPRIGFVLLAIAGLCTWIGAALAFIFFGLGPALETRRGPALLSGVAFVVGLVLFVVGLRG